MNLETAPLPNSLRADAPLPVSPAGAPLDTAVLFVDLVNCSTFASVLGLKEYHDHLTSFHEVCRAQCEHHFQTFLDGRYKRGEEYSYQITGDELVVFMHTRNARNDVYQLATLAVTLKAAWLTSRRNQERLARRAPVADISAGIHHGPVWAVPRPEGGYLLTGYAINLAKRIETLSRHGEHYRIFLSDQAFKLVNTLVPHFIFTPRLRFEAKGILGDVGMYEIAHCFLVAEKRLDPRYIEDLHRILRDAVVFATQDLWMHDLFQVWSARKAGNSISDEAMRLCAHVLKHSPTNPPALYHYGQALRERGQFALAEEAFRTLVESWPQYPHGFMEYAQLLYRMPAERHAEAAQMLLKAEYLGIPAAELDKLRPSPADKSA